MKNIKNFNSTQIDPSDDFFCFVMFFQTSIDCIYHVNRSLWVWITLNTYPYRIKQKKVLKLDMWPMDLRKWGCMVSPATYLFWICSHTIQSIRLGMPLLFVKKWALIVESTIPTWVLGLWKWRQCLYPRLNVYQSSSSSTILIHKSLVCDLV